MHNQLFQLFLQPTFQSQLLLCLFIIPLILLLADVTTGIWSAVVQKKFHWQKVDNFLDKDLKGYVFGSLGIGIFYIVSDNVQLTALATAAFMTPLALHIIASIKSNIQEIGNPVLSALAAPVIAELNTIEQDDSGTGLKLASVKLSTTKPQPAPGSSEGPITLVGTDSRKLAEQDTNVSKVIIAPALTAPSTQPGVQGLLKGNRVQFPDGL